MEAKEISRSKRLLRESKTDNREQARDPHINAAFSGDESVVLELVADPDSENSKTKGNSDLVLNKQGYNIVGGDTRGYDNLASEHEAVNQMKENFGAQSRHQQSHPLSQQLRSPNSTSINHASHGSLPEPQVGFKLGHKHALKTHSGVLKEAEIKTSQKRDSSHVVSIPTDPNRADSQLQQSATSIEVVDEGKSGPSAENEDNKKSGATSPAQRRWRSAMTHQAKSLPAAVERLHPAIAARWQSMRLARQKSAQPRRLLTQLSFSDSDATSIHDYGDLEGGEAIPIKPVKPVGDSEQNEEVKLPPSAIKCFAGLMEQLLKRGKISEVALLNQSGGPPVTLRPMSWTIPALVATGLARAIKETTQPLVRLMVNEKVYVCLNHGSNRLVGHSNDNDVLVAQKTNQYIVLGLSDEETPGSCLQEVLELAEILSDKGW